MPSLGSRFIHTNYCHHIGSVVSGHKPWLPWMNFKIIMSNNQAVLSKNNPKISYRYNPQISQKIYTTVLCVVCDITLSWLSSPVNIRFYQHRIHKLQLKNLVYQCKNNKQHTKPMQTCKKSPARPQHKQENSRQLTVKTRHAYNQNIYPRTSLHLVSVRNYCFKAIVISLIQCHVNSGVMKKKNTKSSNLMLSLDALDAQHTHTPLRLYTRIHAPTHPHTPGTDQNASSPRWRSSAGAKNTIERTSWPFILMLSWIQLSVQMQGLLALDWNPCYSKLNF